MIVSALSVVLAALAVAGAGGLLLFRRMDRCVLAFLLCAGALAGLYLRLNLQFIAAIQITVCVGLLGALLATSLPLGCEQPKGAPHGGGWSILAAVPFAVAVTWGIASGTIGEPILTSPPVWAVQGGYIPALGRELATSYLIPFALLALLLLVCFVSAVYLLGQGKERDV